MDETLQDLSEEKLLDLHDLHVLDWHYNPGTSPVAIEDAKAKGWTMEAVREEVLRRMKK